MNLSRRSIRTKIIALLVVPLAGLVGVWAFATVQTVGPVLTLLESQTRFTDGTVPATALVAQLQAERRIAVTHLGQPSPRALSEQFAATDEALAEFRARTDGAAFRGAASPAATEHLDELLRSVTALIDNRPLVMDRRQHRPTVFALYSETIETAYLFMAALGAGVDAQLSLEHRAVVQLGRWREAMSQVDAMVVGADAEGVFDPSEPHYLHQLIGARRAMPGSFAADLPASVRTRYAALLASRPMADLEYLEERLIDDAHSHQPVPVDMADWRVTQAAVAHALEEFELTTAEALADEGGRIATRIIAQMLAIGVVGLFVVVGTVLASLRMARSLIGRLTTLRDSALELAERRLPDVVTRLRRSEPVDVSTEAPELRLGPDEIGEVGRAFNEVQRTAIAAAVEEARLRQGLNEVFVNIARRSQALLHRQLDLLDQLERETHDPAELEQLFKLDHMTTRMRRHAENLVILAGRSPGRGWRTPVPVVDVVRGAVSEVEDYARVNVASIPEVAVVGRAVGDLIHLLAELVENATMYSPPHTEVQVSGELVPNGLVLEVEDRGLGMTSEAMAQFNAALTSPPTFDPAQSERLGLLVVAQIATRWNLKVTLRPSAYGGVTAVVLIGSELLEEAPPLLPPGLAQPAAGERTSETSVERPELGVQPQRPPSSTLALVGSVEPSTPPTPRSVGRAQVRVEDSGDELPRRVSKRHLAVVQPESVAGEPATDPELPPAEEVRARLSAYQRGLARGRAEATESTGKDPLGTDQ